jgi:hypothetical protein
VLKRHSEVALYHRALQATEEYKTLMESSRLDVVRSTVSGILRTSGATTKVAPQDFHHSEFTYKSKYSQQCWVTAALHDSNMRFSCDNEFSRN